jgi:hypothetical protein
MNLNWRNEVGQKAFKNVPMPNKDKRKKRVRKWGGYFVIEKKTREVITWSQTPYNKDFIYRQPKYEIVKVKIVETL